ncbi:MAG: hypothetical protein IPP79_23035 [Chitinophagaceae bacterium]|nr:hypothetical protein [Chitinophagaceae bacterium]
MKSFLSIVFTLFVITAFSQSPTFTEDAKSLEGSLRTWAQKNGYTQVIHYDQKTDASVFVRSNKDYAIVFVYDISPKVATDFKASLMTPVDSLKSKYTAAPFEIAIKNSAKAELLRFSTNKVMIGNKDKLPVKIEASPKADIYVYSRVRR